MTALSTILIVSKVALESPHSCFCEGTPKRSICLELTVQGEPPGTQQVDLNAVDSPALRRLSLMALPP